ncbi:MAG: hypothetical protein IT210_01640 [Armatimonadetes bacterium]|nr:hypothetical protein [Armatimonadota bacterium]
MRQWIWLSLIALTIAAFCAGCTGKSPTESAVTPTDSVKASEAGDSAPTGTPVADAGEAPKKKYADAEEKAAALPPGDEITKAVEDQPAAIEFGDKKAKVKMVAYYPLNEGHAAIAQQLRKITQQHPGKVQARFVNWQNPDGLAERDANKITCGCVVVDGSDAHKITLNGKTYEVLFQRGMISEWQPEELEQAVKQAVEKKYGKA